MSIYQAGFSPLSRYLSDIRGTRRISTDREEELALSHLPFVVKVAKEYRNNGLEFDDLLSEGNIGLLQAARRYDPSRGAKFITYAVWWIRKSIRLALCDQSRTIRIPTNHYKKRRTGPEWSEPVVVRESGARLDVIADERDSSEVEVLRKECATRVAEAMLDLSETERFVLAHRFGIDDAPILTLREIGVHLGLSHERVRQIEVAAKRRMRGWLNRRDLRRTKT